MKINWKLVNEYLTQPRKFVPLLIVFVCTFIVSCSPVNSSATMNSNNGFSSTLKSMSTTTKSGSTTNKKVVTPTPKKTQKITMSACVDTHALKVRSGPGADYSVNEYLSNGECVALLERNPDSTWVKFGNGWVYLDYMKVDDSVSKLPISSSIQSIATNPPLSLNNASQSTSPPNPNPTSTPKQKPTSTQKPIEVSGCPTGCTSHISGCDIKGNISYNSGERIYHIPGQKYYNETKISPEYGERWFCTGAEARANGWRKSKQ